MIGNHLDINRNNIIICETSINMECYNMKYDTKLIIGKKLRIFSEYTFNKKYNEYSAITLIEENKIAIAYFADFEIYYSIVIFDGISLKYGNLKNIKLKYGYKTIFNLCNDIINYNKKNININLFFNSGNNYKKEGTIVSSFLNGSCNSFIINDINFNEKFQIYFKDKISNGIKGMINQLYFTYIDKDIEIYKNNKKLSIFTEFNKNDQIFAKVKENKSFLSLRYNYENGNEDCFIQLNTKKNYIYINGESYICKINPKIKEINNIIYNDLIDKIFGINDTEFNCSIIFEKKVEKNDLIIYLFDEKINCKIDKKK